MLEELGELLGYALNAADQRSALLEGGPVDVTFELAGGNDVFVDLAGELPGGLRIENIVPRSQDRYLVHFTAEATTLEDVTHAIAELPAIEEVRLLSKADPPLYEALLVGECAATAIADLGANLRSATISESSCRITATLPEDRDGQQYLRRLGDKYPEANLIARQQDSSAPSMAWERLLELSLTDRQRDILAAAYYSGFFDRLANVPAARSPIRWASPSPRSPNSSGSPSRTSWNPSSTTVGSTAAMSGRPQSRSCSRQRSSAGSDSRTTLPRGSFSSIASRHMSGSTTAVAVSHWRSIPIEAYANRSWMDVLTSSSTVGRSQVGGVSYSRWSSRFIVVAFSLIRASAAVRSTIFSAAAFASGSSSCETSLCAWPSITVRSFRRLCRRIRCKTVSR